MYLGQTFWKFFSYSVTFSLYIFQAGNAHDTSNEELVKSQEAVTIIYDVYVCSNYIQE